MSLVPHRHYFSLGFFALVTLAFTAGGQSAKAATLTTWDGSERAITVVNFVADKHLVTRNGEKTENVPLRDLLALQFMTTPPAAPSGTTIWLDDGAVISVSRLSTEGNQLGFISDFTADGKLDLNRVRAIAFSKATTESQAAAEFKKVLATPSKTDVLVVVGKNNDLVSLEGIFVRLEDKNVVFRWQNEDQKIARERVVGLSLSPIPKNEVDRTEFVSVNGSDGSVLQGRLTDLNAEAAALDVPGIGNVKIAARQIHSIDFSVGRAVSISVLEPSSIEETPYFDYVFRFRRNTSVGGKPLSIGGVKYAQGLGVHSRSALTYALGKQYRRFIGRVGIDDEVGRSGNVVFKVRADGKEIFNSGNVKGGDAAKRFSLDVSNAQTLILEVDFGEDMDIGDHADWADLKLLK